MNHPFPHAIFENLTSKEMSDILEFILECGKLKSVIRQTYMPQQDRFENTAEHSWHLIMMAILLKQYANTAINLEKVIKMLALHDLGEIKSGDTIHYSKNTQSETEEADFIRESFSSLPQALQQEMLDVWNEFNDGKTEEAKYARALDRFQPFLYMLHNGGESWQRNKITYETALKKNAHIADGSNKLWDAYQILAMQPENNKLFYNNTMNSV